MTGSRQHRGGGPARVAAVRLPLAERDFQVAVLDAAHRLGWETFHPHDSRRSRSGWPDLALWKPGRGLILRELKVPGGRVSAAQAATLASLRAAGVDAAIWTPADWPAILADLRPRNGAKPHG